MSTSAYVANQQPLIRAGVQVNLFGAPAEPRFFEQDFDAKTATVKTVLTFAKGIKISIDAFLNADSIWCEKVQVLDNPENIEIDLGFEICAPETGFRCMQFKNECEVSVNAKSDVLEFTYDNATYRGKGALIPSVPFDELYSDNKNVQRAFARGMYKNVQKGFCVERAMLCVGTEENVDYVSLLEKAKSGFYALHTAHKEEWKSYFSTCEIDIPDEKLKQIYDMGRYIIKSHQNPETGLITLGMLPNLWQGGICCAYDESFPHDAFLTAGNFKESVSYTRSYLLFADECRKLLSEKGIKGTTFYGWTNTDGKYVTDYIDKFQWITNVKPLFSAYCAIAIYSEWLYHPEVVGDDLKAVLRDLLLFYTNYMLQDKGDVAYVRNVQSGTEAGYEVETDTFTQTVFAAAFYYGGILLADEQFVKISEKMYVALSENINADGVLLPHQNAPYIGGMIKELFKYLPDAFDKKASVDADEKVSETCWGLDNDLTSEEYRHWPWNDSKTARCYIRLKNSVKAMERLGHMGYGASSLGVLPEKIRLDGYPVNYYYTSTAGSFVAAMNEACACSKGENELIIAGCFDVPWTDFSCKDIRAAGNISVSVKVENGKMVYLKIQNNSKVNRHLRISVNPRYMEKMPANEILVEAGTCFEKNVKLER